MAMIEGPEKMSTSGANESLVVLLHGYGANGDDLFGLAEPLSAVLPDTAFVAPNAPQRSRVNPLGYQWFPVPWIDGSPEAEMIAGFRDAVVALNAFLDRQMERFGLDERRVALVGFSQGTMMSLEVGPRRATALAGIVGFSGRLVEAERLKTDAVTRPPILLVHGDQDEIIPVAALTEAREGLVAADFSVRSHVSEGVGHGIAPDGLQVAAAFLREQLAPSTGGASQP